MKQHDVSRGLGIDIKFESVMSFTEAAHYVGKLKGTKGLAFQTLFRWATKGCRGVVLETICVGGSRCTSKEALQRFFTALTAARDATGEAHPPIGGGARVGPAGLGDADAVLRRAGIFGGEQEGAS